MTTSSILDVLGDLIFVVDETGACHEWNRAVVGVTGYPADELATMTLADFFEGDDADRVMDAVTGALGTGDAVVTADIVAADGERTPYEFNVRRGPGGDDGPTRVVGVGRDVSEHHRRQERVENRERVLREMYDVIADRERPFAEQVDALLELGRGELDTDYGTLSRIDGDDYVFEVVSADDDSIRSGDVVPLAATNCEVAARDERTLVLGDVARDAPEQTDRAGYVDWGIACYIGAPVVVDDEVYGTFCFYGTEPRDGTFQEWEVTLVDLMSRWVSYELQHERARERLQRQNETLERFTSVVSHDLRNPLNVLEGSVELAAETGDAAQLERATRAIERMNALIDDLLTLARSGETIHATEPVDLTPLVERCWESVATSDAALVVEAERTVRADEARLRQLLENLVRNGVEHGGDSTTVTVGDLPDGFYVADDGPGIPDTDRERVFESGYTTTADGTGFGLAIVAEVADAHGWDVRVTESAAGGARFEFTGVSASGQ